MRAAAKAEKLKKLELAGERVAFAALFRECTLVQLRDLYRYVGLKIDWKARKATTKQTLIDHMREQGYESCNYCDVESQATCCMCNGCGFLNIRDIIGEYSFKA